MPARPRVIGTFLALGRVGCAGCDACSLRLGVGSWLLPSRSLWQPSAWRLHFPSDSSSVQLLVVSAAWDPQQAADTLPTPGSCWQHLPHELHAAGTNRDETHPRMRGTVYLPCLFVQPPLPDGILQENKPFHTLIAQWGNVGATGEENGGLTASRELAQSNAACNCLGVGVWQRLGPGYFCCCSLCSPAPFPIP